MVDPVSVGAILVALIAAVGAWASQRTAAKSSLLAAQNNAEASKANNKATAELEAYNRARAMDVATIQRQDEELEELRSENEAIKRSFKALEREHEEILRSNREQQREIENLKAQVKRLQRWKGTGSTYE